MSMSHCYRCRRRFGGSDEHDADRWNAVFRGGHPMALLCPDCQTEDEDAEAERNLARIDYVAGGRLPDGRFFAQIKSESGETP